MEIKPIKFISFEKFLQQKVKSGDEKSPLFYCRTYGNKAWGFAINAAYEMEYKIGGDRSDIMQVSFLTNCVSFSPDMNRLFSSGDYLITLDGINEENFNKATEWITAHRNRLLDSVINLSGLDNPMIDMKMKIEFEQEVVEDD